ncbi:cytochrome c oxidase subunit II [Halocatena pleomorpha]|uniref:cytochrome-c oxidase n=1 Tax=Halocatena pleomorpha TaxID=1785090 RepID=A0A3P3RDF7_9EURY|nr:cytochrome c oxidase subunit II [Halocatena pleomorpha]RRJ31496.1 cytochrome c oxidase subunit II [Halocatena pleomorpha]
MNQSRLLPLVVLLVGLIVITVAVVPLPTPGYDSVSEVLLRTLHRRLLLVAVPLTLLVEGAILYAMITFHANNDPKPTEERPSFEITWTVVVVLILLFVGTSSYLVLGNLTVSAGPDMTNSSRPVDVHVTGQNWFWEFTYPDEEVTTTNTLVLPANRTILFRITSTDVIHSVHIPALGVKQDAFPGRTTTFKTNVTKAGTYRLYCAEFCGVGHSTMLATVRVVAPPEYQQWLQQHKRTQSDRPQATDAT